MGLDDGRFVSAVVRDGRDEDAGSAEVEAGGKGTEEVGSTSI